MDAPKSMMSPEVGYSKPAIKRSSVVLPQPDGPSSVKNSLLLIVKETSSRAVRMPVSTGNVLVTEEIPTADSAIEGYNTCYKCAARWEGPPQIRRISIALSVYTSKLSFV